MKKINVLLIIFFVVPVFISAQISYELKEDIAYYEKAFQASDAYVKERCKLDVYYPKDTAQVSTVIWFHGGGLENGEKHIPEGLLEKGVAVVSVNYRKICPFISCSKDAPPMLLITGNRELELLGRYEEVAYLFRMLKVVEHPDVELMELDGYGHDMVYPAIPLLLKFVKEKSRVGQL